MWQKVKAFCLHSATIAWSYILAVVGFLLQILDAMGPDALGDPSIQAFVQQAFGDAKITGRILLGISVINILARMRSLRKQL